MFSIVNKGGSKYDLHTAERLDVFEQYLKIQCEQNTIIVIDLSRVEFILINENEYYVYTGQEYDTEMKVDYEDFCDLSKAVAYEDLNENFYWSASNYKHKAFVVCNSMLEILESERL